MAQINLTQPTSFKGKQGTDNMSGLQDTLFVACLYDMTTLAELSGDFNTPTFDETTPEGLVKITTDHVFPVGKGFYALKMVYDTLSLEMTGGGKVDQNGYKCIVKGTYVGPEVETEIMLATFGNNPLVLLTRNMQNVLMQFGGVRGVGCYLMPSFKTNNLTGDRAEYEFTFETFQARKTFYEGDITLKA